MTRLLLISGWVCLLTACQTTNQSVSGESNFPENSENIFETSSEAFFRMDQNGETPGSYSAVSQRYTTGWIMMTDQAMPVVLHETREQNGVLGMDGSDSHWHVEVISLEESNTGKFITTFSDRADDGRQLGSDGRLYTTTRWACCDAVESHRLFELTTGRPLFSYSGELLSLRIPNQDYQRLAGFLPANAMKEHRKDIPGYAGTLYYANAQNVLDSCRIFLTEESGFTPRMLPNLNWIRETDGRWLPVGTSLDYWQEQTGNTGIGNDLKIRLFLMESPREMKYIDFPVDNEHLYVPDSLPEGFIIVKD